MVVKCKPISSIIPTTYSTLDIKEKSLIDKLSDFEAPWLEEKLLLSGTFKSEEEYNQAFTEFKKYIALIGLVGGELAMASKQVDVVWHQFILFTKQYSVFGDEMLGRYIHHSPETSHTRGSQNSVSKFIEAYNTHYGILPDIWNVSAKDCEGCTYPEMDCGTDD
ncbi:MAG TPA: hypothetical protein VJJ53_02460 [Candidatus Nanoarchaeia archaeon]|nr:hypothetical protein [Candidatus Nanoarchaeia archaeon]